MTINEERESFTTALHETALGFDLPLSADLYDGAVRRGRQIKRRRALGTGAAAGLALAVAGVLTAVLASPATTPSHPSVPVASATPAGLGRYMAENLKALLPRGASLQQGTGALPLSGDGYDMRSNDGTWQAGASAFIVYHGEKYSIDFQVAHQRATWDCSADFIRGTCTMKQLGAGTLITMSDQPNVPQSYSYYWNLPGNKQIELQVDPNLNAATKANPFTEQQVLALLTAPAWTSVLAGLPAVVVCPDLEPVSIGGRPNAGWKCTTTGKVYPQSADVYAASS